MPIYKTSIEPLYSCIYIQLISIHVEAQWYPGKNPLNIYGNTMEIKLVYFGKSVWTFQPSHPYPSSRQM